MNSIAVLNRNSIARRIPGETGIWVFVLGDMTAFGVFFAVFLAYRRANPDLYLQSQLLLDQNLGAINTLILLLSSWLVVLAVQAVRSNRLLRARSLLGGAVLCALGFIVVKYFEWSAKLASGIGLTKNEFFSFYYMFTGIHLLHVIIGMILLALLMQHIRQRPHAINVVTVEAGATYWHMVDLLWIVLFPLFYLLK